ncbi:MAG: carboxypeptidase M32 [Akkermansiaceae bacterium]|nr:carboxypeptidase M32 [Akkermansiaceae bacterium]
MTSYERLCDKVREISLVNDTASALSWDQETYMPTEGLAYRAKQIAWLAGNSHNLGTCDDFRKALENAENESLDDTQSANIRETRNQFDRSSKLPQDLVKKASESATFAKAAWAEARQKSDFSMFAPHLERLLDIARTKADLWGYEDEPYDAMLEGYERGTKTKEIANIFDSVTNQLTNTAQAAVDKSASISSDILEGECPIEKQQLFNREIAEDIGFEFNKGRIDTTTHPFCVGLGPCDTRLTTRYLLNDFTSSVFGVLHEAGHGLYEQGLPETHHGLPSGNAVSLGIHESQSRLWENHIGRSRPFWTKWLPRAQELFPHLAAIDLDTFLGAVNRAEKSFIRVEADEATYDLHILLRFEIERAMMNQEIQVAEIPDIWNQKFESLFGTRPPDDANGCLQDIHWAMGGLGYFATYTLGNFNAAQLYNCAMKDTHISSAFERADYLPMLEWMRKKIHSKGSVLLPQELMLDATGEKTNPQHHIDHLNERFV